LRDLGGIRVLRTALRCGAGLLDEFSKCIEADLGSAALGSVATNANSARSSVARLVLCALIAVSFLRRRNRFRRPDWLIVQQISRVIPSRSRDEVHDALAWFSRSRNALWQ
jgi:hypothetical protein